MMKTKNVPIKVVVYAVLILVALIIAFPIYVTFATAFKTKAESTANFFSLPSSLYLENFKTVMSDANFGNYVINSILITVISIVVIAIMIPMVSWVITRNMKRSKYYTGIYWAFVMSIFVPFQVLMVPVTQWASKLGLLNQAGLIILYCTFALGQGVFLFVGFFRSIPLELEEAAEIDGCGVTRTFFQIVYPLAKPMTATVVILDVLWIWNDFLLPLLILNKTAANYTLPLYQYNFKSAAGSDYNLQFASFMFSIVPMMIIYFILQKNIIEGMTAGAVKS